MLTRMFSAVPSDSWPLMAGVVALSLLGAPVTSAEAGGIVAGTCVRSLGSLSCVARWGEAGDPYIRGVPGPRNAQEEAEFVERDRKWVARCRPVIRQDQYGVGRYYYAAPGCEFGRIQD
jgi:hypothetical protein